MEVLQTEQHNEGKPHIIKINNGSTPSTNMTDVDQVNNAKEPVILNTIPNILDAPKSSTEDSETIVQNVLINMKSDVLCSTNSENKTNMDCNVKSYDSNDKNLCLSLSTSNSNFNPSETLVFSSTETTYSDVNNVFTTKKKGFSIEEISKDEVSQNSQSMSSYSNDYTCFLSEQTDAISNLTPFKRSNSYYFDSPVKKLCSTKLDSEEKPNKLPNATLFSSENNSKIYTGFTSIQNDLEVDCIQDRYDGSDSGFGSELAEDKNCNNLDVSIAASNSSYKNDFALNQESSFEDLQRTSNEFLSAMEVLKPKFSDSVVDSVPIEVKDNYVFVKGILKRNKPINYGVLASDIVSTEKKRKNINFTNVTVFYFPRVQGFTCVPSQVIILDLLFIYSNFY
jgi:cysteine/serine-rich nuclear protein